MIEEAKRPAPNKGKELSKCKLHICLTLCQCSDYMFQELLQLAEWSQNLGFFLSGEVQLENLYFVIVSLFAGYHV